MQQNILYVGLDVDDTQYHGSAFNKDTGAVCDFKCRPTLARILHQKEGKTPFNPLQFNCID